MPSIERWIVGVAHHPHIIVREAMLIKIRDTNCEISVLGRIQIVGEEGNVLFDIYSDYVLRDTIRIQSGVR